ncbi:hypothetical protein QTP86_020138, partial [Hemibagrus guttatus]
MSCQLQSRITAILILTTLPLFLTTHGSVFGRNQRTQVGSNLPKVSKRRGEGKINLAITKQRSNAASSETQGRRFSQIRHSIVDETENLNNLNTSSNTNKYMLTPRQVGADVKELFQSDSPGFDGQAVQGKVNLSSTHITEEWLQMRPHVQCSPAAIILTAKGWNYVHLLVDRVGSSPVSLLHLPSHCGYNVRATWRDLILIVPYDGCYVLQQNGSYVLPLLWWGMPMSISCPMTPASALTSPSGFCSNLGITLMIEGSLRRIEKYSIKVNEEWVPLVSSTCAYLMDSATENLILFIPFTVQCAKDGGSTLNILLDEKITKPNSKASDGTMVSDRSLASDASTSSGAPESTSSDASSYSGAPEASSYSGAPEAQLPHVPQEPQLPQVPQKPQLPQVPQEPQLPQVPQEPQLPQVPQEPQLPQVPQEPQLPQVPQEPQLPQVPQEPQLPQVPQEPQPPQMPQKPQHVFPVLANDSSQLSPVLSCKGDHLRASLPFTKINSIKVKDVKRKVWVPVSSTSAHCGYSLQRKGKGVVFSSPLPACHSYRLSPSLLSLSLKFWDSAIPRHRALRLQCPYNSTSPTMTEPSTTASLLPKPISTHLQPARNGIRPSHPQKLLGLYSKPSKPKHSPLQIQNPSVPFLSPPKPTAASFQQSKDTKPTSWMTRTKPLMTQMQQPQVLCHAKDMSVTLPPGPITGLTVKSPIVGVDGSIEEMLLDEASSRCGYIIKKNQDGGINILLPYTSCHMAHQDEQYQIVLKYHTADGHANEASLSCQVPMNHECSLPSEQRLACGSSSVSAAECYNLGCCYSPDTQTCYYPMDECTADRHFVFSIPGSLTEPPLSPALLSVAGNSSCTPQRVVEDMALFKIPLDGCGAHRYEVGNTVIYMLEILNTLQSVTLNYGTITRDSPFRLLVECRFLPGIVTSVGYLVKSPSLGPSIQAKGVFGVQLRIAKDQQYSSYYPQYHRPLRKLLGKPLYLEVRLLNPLDPSTVLLVHYCVAYPRSAHSAWVLIYDGCPNPLDVTPSHEPPPALPEGLANHVRRFTVSTFQFLEDSRKEMTPGGEEEDEKEVYFMCATEVCLPSEGPCVEGCIDHSP